MYLCIFLNCISCEATFGFSGIMRVCREECEKDLRNSKIICQLTCLTKLMANISYSEDQS